MPLIAVEEGLKHHGPVLLAMAVVVLKVVALIFQRIERLIFHLPPRPATAHEFIDVPRTHPYVRHPTEVLDRVLADLPILHKIDPHVGSRGIERHVIDKAKPMRYTCGTVMPCLRGQAPGFFSGLHLGEEIRMIAFFDPENIVATVIMQGLDVGSIGTETVFSDNEVEMGVVLTQLDQKAFGRIAFTIISGMNGITSRRSGWIIAAPNIW